MVKGQALKNLFMEKVDEFFQANPELDGKDVRFTMRRWSFDVDYEGRRVTFSYNNRISGNACQMFLPPSPPTPTGIQLEEYKGRVMAELGGQAPVFCKRLTSNPTFEFNIDESKLNCPSAVEEGKFLKKIKEFFLENPDLKGEKIIFTRRKKSIAIDFEGKRVNIGYVEKIPSNMRERLKLSGILTPVDIVPSGIVNSFFNKYPKYVPFRTIIVFHPVVNDETYTVSSTRAEVCFGPERYLYSSVDSQNNKIAFQELDKCWEAAETQEDAVKKFVITRCPEYENTDFSVTLTPPMIGTDGYSIALNLRNVISLSELRKRKQESDTKRNLREYIRNHVPEQFDKCYVAISKDWKVHVELAPRTDIPIANFLISYKANRTLDADTLFAAYDRELEKALESVKFNTSNKRLHSKIFNSIEGVINAYRKAGYFALDLEFKSNYPYYRLLSQLDISQDIKAKKNKDGSATFTVGKYVFQYDPVTYDVICVERESDEEIKEAVCMLKKCQECRRYLADQLFKAGPFKCDYSVKTDEGVPRSIVVSIKRSGFKYQMMVPVDVKKQEIRSFCSDLKKRWAEYEKEKRKQDRRAEKERAERKKQKEKEQKEQDKRDLAKCQVNQYYGDLFVAGIISVITLHSWDQSISALGKELKSMSGCCRKYTHNDYYDKVEQLVKDGVLLKQRKYSSKYSLHYDAYQLAEHYLAYLADPMPTHYGKNKKYAEYTDADWEAFLHGFNPKMEQSDLIWKRQIPIWQRTNVLLACSAEMQKYFNAAPEHIQAYVQALYDTSDDRFYKRALRECIGKKK